MLLKSDMASLRLDEITDQNRNSLLPVSNISQHLVSIVDCAHFGVHLRLAVDWGKLQTRAKITLAKGERMRERVVTDSEMKAYLAACPQPWKDAATIIRGSAACPGEVFALRWPNVLLNGHGGLIQITDGKTKFRKRLLPMVPEVYVVLKDRWEAAGRPSEGWVFPSDSEDGHFNGDSAKDQHAKALRDSGVKPFEPYCLRHTALTRLAESGCDVFTLMRIAGHSNIQTTMRYIHPQAEAVEMAFQRLQGELTGTKLGTMNKTANQNVIRMSANCWCERGDSNPHGFTRQILSLVRLPIPPLSHLEISYSICRDSCNLWGLGRAPILVDFVETVPKLVWLSHTAVSDEDFSKNPTRNRLAVFLNRTNHASFHIGQIALTK